MSLGWSIRNITFPESSNLVRISLSCHSTKVRLNNIPNLNHFQMLPTDRCQNFLDVYIGKNVGTNKNYSFKDFIHTIYVEQTKRDNKLQSIHVENIDWDNFDAEALAWLSERPTCELYGRIGIAEGTNEHQTSVTWDLKNKFIKKFGDIDTGNGDLTLEYRKRNFEASTAKIKGNFFVDDYIVRDRGYNDVETFDFSVAPESTYMNTQTKIQFSLEGGNTSAYSMSADGKLSVNVYQLSDKQNFATIKAAVTQYENGSFVTENVTKKIEIWNRPAQIGDVVYYDGSYGSAEDYVEGDKTPVGVCFYLAPRNADGSINATFHNPNDKMTRLMISLESIKISSTTDEFKEFCWGPDSSLTNAERGVYDIDENGNRVKLYIDNGKTQIYDVPGNRNTSYSQYNSQMTEDNMRDSSDFGLQNNGFRAHDAITPLGDGFAYNESPIQLAERTVNSDIINLIAEGYSIGDVINSGYARTLNTIAFRNKILQTGFEGLGLKPDTPEFHIPNGNDEMFDLAQAMSAIKKWAESGGVVPNEGYPIKWTSFYFPAISVAYAYQPTVKNNEVLDEKFLKRNWFLLTCGLWSRIYYYTYHYSTSNPTKRTDGELYESIRKGLFNPPDPSINAQRIPSTSVELNTDSITATSFWGGTSFNGPKGITRTVWVACAF